MMALCGRKLSLKLYGSMGQVVIRPLILWSCIEDHIKPYIPFNSNILKFLQLTKGHALDLSEVYGKKFK
jgi:hypothetical protein